MEKRILAPLFAILATFVVFTGLSAHWWDKDTSHQKMGKEYKDKKHDAQAKAKLDATLKPQSKQIKKLKQEMRTLHNKILQYDPCFAARESLKDPSWEAFFI